MESHVASETEDPTRLSCSIHGFDTNLPMMDYYWYYNEMQLPPRSSKYRMNVTEAIVGATSDLVIEETGWNFIHIYKTIDNVSATRRTCHSFSDSMLYCMMTQTMLC